MESLARRIVLSQGWQRRLIALGCGAIGALSLPPLNWLPCFFVPMIASVWLLDGACAKLQYGRSVLRFHVASIWQAACTGWWLGFGYFLGGLWWLGAAFLVEADQFAWAMPLGVIGLPAVLAAYFGIGFGLARLMWVPGAGRLLPLVLGLSVSEWLRGHLFTGFPWNDIGMVLGSHLWLAQIASIIGLDGLRALTILIFAAPAVAVGMGAVKLRIVSLPALALLALAIFGLVRLPAEPTPTVKGVMLRIVQPNQNHGENFRSTASEQLMQHFLALSDQATSPQTNGMGDFTHIIWPESPFPFLLARNEKAMAALRNRLPSSTVLITGAARASLAPGSQVPQYFNSIYVIGAEATILDVYDKTHLVPFGEYVPFSDLLKRFGLQQFVLSPFTPGVSRKVLDIPGLPPALPLICYEAIFSGDILPKLPPGVGPKLIINVTDDSWFGLTPGPYQHLAQARLRAIEQGLPVIRAAETGISAIVDPFGRIVASLPLGREGVLDGALPQSISATIFSLVNGWVFLTICCIALICSCILRLHG